jgi:FMN-dependent NADH-azoreductase
MSNILVIESSLFPAEISASRSTVAVFVDRWLDHEPDAVVVRRDLAATALPHAGLDLLSGWMTPADQRSPAQTEAVARSRQLIDELFAADVVVIGAPMYNFSIPSTLKAWIDHVAIAGQTFRYNEQGRPEGLVTGKRVMIIASRGGIYSEGPMVAFNHQDPYLRAVLGLLGMTDLTVVGVEAQKMGADHSAGGRAAAVGAIDAFLSENRDRAAA